MGQKYKNSMDNVGDWVYILLVAVGIIASVWPKKPKTESIEEPADPPVVDLEEADFWLETSYTNSQIQEKISDTAPTFGPYKSHVAMVMTEPEPIEESEIERTDPSVQRWRQSIVDAEILKPKYQSY